MAKEITEQTVRDIELDNAQRNLSRWIATYHESPKEADEPYEALVVTLELISLRFRLREAIAVLDEVSDGENLSQALIESAHEVIREIELTRLGDV